MPNFRYRALLGLACSVAAGVAVYLATPTDPSSLARQVASAAARVDVTDTPSGVEVVATPRNPNGSLVLYVHGARQNARAILEDPQNAPLTVTLLDAGYTVAAGDAGGDAWGNDASVADYVSLAARARSQTRTSSTFILAESMGGLAGARLTDGRIPDVQAFAGIYPVCDMSSVYGTERLRAQIDAAYPGAAAAAVAANSPVRVNPAIRQMYWASPDDDVVPAAVNSQRCAADTVSAGGSAVVHETSGSHGAAASFDPPAIITFFAIR